MNKNTFNKIDADLLRTGTHFIWTKIIKICHCDARFKYPTFNKRTALLSKAELLQLNFIHLFA